MKSLSDRFLFLGITVFSLVVIYIALMKTPPRIVQLFQPATTMYYVLGAVCLLVQLGDLYLSIKRGRVL